MPCARDRGAARPEPVGGDGDEHLLGALAAHPGDALAQLLHDAPATRCARSASPALLGA
jgi:hypothetical protein